MPGCHYFIILIIGYVFATILGGLGVILIAAILILALGVIMNLVTNNQSIVTIQSRKLHTEY